MIFGIPFLLGIATFFIFIFGGASAIIGTHGGKELDPEGAEILYLASHPKYKNRPLSPKEADDSAPSENEGSQRDTTVLPIRRPTDTESSATQG